MTEIKSAALELGTERIRKLLVQYAVPAIIAMTASSLYNMVDSIFIGHGVGPLAISGLALTFPLMNLAAAFGSLVGVGAATLVSMRLGQRDYETAQNILGNVVVLNLIIGLSFGLVTLLFLDPILYFFGASDATIGYARDYMTIILLGNVITHMYLGLNSVLRASGHPRKSMYATIYTVVINAALDPLFIYGFGWGIRGAAVATILAQVIALVWQFHILSDKSELLHFRPGIYRLRRKIVRDILAIGMSPFLMNLAACFIVILINKGLKQYGGDLMIGAYGIVNRLAFFFVMIVLGVNQGMQPIAGYNFGAKQYDRVMRVLKLTMIGVTGTKGKTTTTYLFKSIVESAGMRCGIIGTTGCIAGQTKLPSHLTTPDPIEMFEILRIMADAGVEVVCMEVSAHALYLRKLVGVVFEAAAYTNLSQDHLDFFGTMDNYLAAKKLLFSAGMARNAAVNVDEETAKAVCDSLDCPLLTYGISGKADLFARDIEITETGVSFTLNLRNLHAERVHLLLTGMFNVYNALAAAACALILGVELDAIKRGLEAVVSVPGRVEMLPTKTPYRMILDYSHSPDALENILKTVREFCHGRIILVFGCGGDRDKGKRPMMGEIAGRLADYAILTSDNPRFEDPMAILAAIEAGIKPTGAKYEVIENRREAIRQAMEMAVSGDIVVLAGKGHETYQDIAGVKHPFDEKVIVSELLEEIARENRLGDAAQTRRK